MPLLLPVLIAMLLAKPVDAQPALTAVATVNTPVYLQPDTKRTPLRVAAPGTVFSVLAEQGDWTQVEFKDPEFGLRIGFVATSNLRFRRPELVPMDLSVDSEPPAPVRPTSRPVPPRMTEEQPSQALRQSSQAQSLERVWIDVNVGAAVAAEKDFTFEVTDSLFQEVRTLSTTYRNPTGASFDFGGGVMITEGLGFGVSVTGAAHQHEAEVFASVPHPFAFNAFGTDRSETERQFQRIEGGANLQIVGVVPIGDRARFRGFAGPTYFRLQQDLVSGIRYDQAFGVLTRVNEIAITDYEFDEKVEATGWGYHVGADLSYFFTRVFGLGGFARFNRANLEIEEPISGDLLEVKAGGFQVGGGVRFKF